jgi:hypothetical protein
MDRLEYRQKIVSQRDFYRVQTIKDVIAGRDESYNYRMVLYWTGEWYKTFKKMGQ